MSRTYSKVTNKHQKHPEVFFQQYLYNATEPREDMSYSSPEDLDSELFENSESLRQGFRHLARRIRNR